MSFHEIFKCVRDGLNSKNKNYKDVCFRIMLKHIYLFSRDNPEAMSVSEAQNIQELYFEYHDICSACDEAFDDFDLNVRNDCGCKMICHNCVMRHDKECEDYKALTLRASKAPREKDSSS